MAAKLDPPPLWWSSLAVYAAARYSPNRSVNILRETGQYLLNHPGATAHQLYRDAGDQLDATTNRVLAAFFETQGLVLPQNNSFERTAAALQRYLDVVAVPLRQVVVQYNDAQQRDQERRKHTGNKPLSSITILTRIRILRDLSLFLCQTRLLTGWEEVSSSDIEHFLALHPAALHQQTYVLRRFFAWAKSNRLIVINPTQQLQLGPMPAMTSAIMDLPAQRVLFDRWTSNSTPAEERVTGLLSLLHAASNIEIRSIKHADINHAPGTIRFVGRSLSVQLDPWSWEAVLACQKECADTNNPNPHLITSRVTRCRDTPVSSSYLSRLMSRAGTTPARCRQTRISQLVNDLDPTLAATVLGMHDSGLIRYLTHIVDQDRLSYSLGSATNPT